MKRNRKSIRLKNYDYSMDGYYFVTVCANNRRHLFGDIDCGEMVLNDAGLIAAQCWNEIPVHFPCVTLDEFIVMPNHVHGILIITDNVGANNYSPLRVRMSVQSMRPRGTSKTIGSMIRGFKIGVTKWFHQNTDIRDIWQRNYHDHIIRGDADLYRIRQYIINNPAGWEDDEYYGNEQ